MEKIIIDTNILYSWVEVYVNEKLPPDEVKKLSENCELYLTTASIAEVIVKFRSDLETIKRCFKPLLDKELKIISIGFIPVASEVIKRIYYAKSILEVEDEIKDVFEMKVTKEAELLRFFLISILFGIFHGIRESNGYKLIDPKLDRAFLLSSKALIEGNSEFIFETFKHKLLKGYASGQVQQTIREELSEWILRMITIWIMNFYLAKYGVLVEDIRNPDQEKMNKAMQDLKNDSFQHKIIKNIDNPFKIISQSSIHTFSEDYISELSKELEGHELITDQANDYIIHKIEKSLKNGAKVQKNDVLDLLILYSLNLEDFKFITFDTNLILALKTIDKDSHNYIKSLGID